ncbi:hypothetical protein [Lyngbya sp. CCY1209]|uniref:hypothetical protein n=1 Tax=Lyngbya sp. CCY1209 TaxID=2886103 RepID=UPI002D208029|nr:hypothetical protein [Lyngbya sp. CCY1209]MEB3884021.1 hypothetical protein [Lyngbya sp. CCY1209]
MRVRSSVSPKRAGRKSVRQLMDGGIRLTPVPTGSFDYKIGYFRDGIPRVAVPRRFPTRRGCRKEIDRIYRAYRRDRVLRLLATALLSVAGRNR